MSQRDMYGRIVTGLHEACKGSGCPACFETGAAVSGPPCRCGHPTSLHVRESCVALAGPGWDFCPCEALEVAAR